MKKVLFATTALVMTAGVAAAEVAVSGTGRMGMVYDGDDIQFSSRARAIFTLSGESDAGLSFGGEFRADNAGSANRGLGGEVYVSGAYGKLSMGDTVSATEAAIGDLASVGYTEGAFGGDIEEIWYLTGDGENLDQGPNVLYEYTVNQISFFASMSDGSNNVQCGVNYVDGSSRCGVDPNYGDDDANEDLAYALAAKYDAGNWSAGLGFADNGDASEVVIGGEGKFGNVGVKGIYAYYKDRPAPVATADTFEHTIGLSMTYTADALTIKGFARQDKHKIEGGGHEKYNAFGIGADYDLGGGATLAGGIMGGFIGPARPARSKTT
jgi:outer membrane protein OmpU